MPNTVPLSALMHDIACSSIDDAAAQAAAAGLAITADELGRQALTVRDARQLITAHQQATEAAEAASAANIALQNHTREWEQARNAAVDRAYRAIITDRGNTPGTRQDGRNAAHAAGAKFERDNPVPRTPSGERTTHLLYTTEPAGLLGKLKEAIR